MKRRNLSVLLWVAAIVLTLVLAVFQRLTGPTHPLRGTAVVNSQEVAFKFLRSHPGDGGLKVSIPDPGLPAELIWRHYPSNEDWMTMVMVSVDGQLVAEIPHQPPAGKVEYRVEFAQDGDSDGDRFVVPANENVVARFRGEVPASVIIPHVFAMFFSMLISTRAFLEVLRPGNDGSRILVVLAMGLLMLGGLCLGPIVQKFAFGAYWTGWPYGTDLTDNKTLFAFFAWLPATVLALTGRRQRIAVIFGWIVMMGIFLIPHSMRGSEIDWEEQGTAGISKTQ